jgi:hypothetical protein
LGVVRLMLLDITNLSRLGACSGGLQLLLDLAAVGSFSSSIAQEVGRAGPSIPVQSLAAQRMQQAWHVDPLEWELPRRLTIAACCVCMPCSCCPYAKVAAVRQA